MTISKLPTIVSSHWLREQICLSMRASTQSHRVLDTSWMPDPDVDGYTSFYKEAHIPTAQYFDLKKVSPIQQGSTVKFQIPSKNFFQDYVENLGITNSTHVIAYDRFNSRPSFRTWFLFRVFGHDRVSVLNGGLRKWLRDGYHVTTDEPTVKRSQFQVKFRKELLRDFKSMKQNVDTQSEQMVDARGKDSFYYSEEADSGGHIPGSINVPFDSLFNEDGTFKSEEALKKLFSEAGLDLQKPIVSTCQTGMTACAVIAAAHLLGKEDVPLYNGSFTEWSQLADSSQIARKRPS